MSFLIIECCVRREGCVMVETRCGAVNGPKPRKEWKGMKILLCVEPYEILCSTKMIFNLDKLLIFSRNRKHPRWEGWNAASISRAYIYAISYVSLSTFNEEDSTQLVEIQERHVFFAGVAIAMALYTITILCSRAQSEKEEKRRKNQPLLIFEDSTLYKYKLIFHPSLDIGQNTSPSTPTPTFISSLLSLSLVVVLLQQQYESEWRKNTWKKIQPFEKKKKISKNFSWKGKRSVCCVWAQERQRRAWVVG